MNFENLEILAEGMSFGIPADEIVSTPTNRRSASIPQSKPKPEKPKDTPSRVTSGHHSSRKKVGDKVGDFVIVGDTGKTLPNRCAVYEMECPICHKVRKMSANYARKIKSCGCLRHRLRAQTISAKHKEESDLRMMRAWRGVYCSPESASLVFTNIRRPGKLALYADLSKRDREMLAETLAAQQPPEDKSYLNWEKLNAAESILGERFLEVLDLFQHDQISFFTRDVIVRADRAVELWLRFKDGDNFDSMASAFGTTAEKVIKTLYAVSVRLQITAFIEVKYGKHSAWSSPFTADRWGEWETVESLHQTLYEEMIRIGEKHLADHQKKVINDVLTKLENQTKVLGI